ncbi:hypothetical protein ALNOE001_18060 [Candidatus Methanobinarius endosymbioticus]|uniref:Uncharacterized protein n=1 Tax=Candidatus Methanobinarius endosymbioticus TaxID=2006182 RepID=A0A366M8R0_9EURY|nr:hypothetical protein ALNOE001_18060 [Candidatus Methanobinarius endosymbioticus]
MIFLEISKKIRCIFLLNDKIKHFITNNLAFERVSNNSNASEINERSLDSSDSKDLDIPKIPDFLI